MKSPASAFCLFALVGFLQVNPAFSSGDRTVHLFTAMDIGRLESGYDFDKKYDPKGMAMNRTYVDVTVIDQVSEAYRVSIGVGGIFWKAFELETGEPEAKVIKFGPGISNAFLQYAPSESWNLSFGYFPYKYNEYARNLGEYLFRTEAYPTIVFTGGWGWMNDANYRTPGLKLTYKTETFNHDFCLFGEYFNSPIFDFSPAYVTTWKPHSGITVGGGVNFHRFLSPNGNIRKELTRPYTYYKDFYIPAAPAGSLDSGRQATVVSRLKADIIEITGNDALSSDAYFALPENAGKDSLVVRFDDQAIILNAFVNLNLNALLGLDAQRMGAFEVYGEVAQLGLKNYPIFYTQYSQRMPVMLGVSLPTFGLLNNLTLETEYLKNPNVESLASTFDHLDLPPDGNFRYKNFNKDDFKWSVHASRDINSFLKIFVQVANDHMRLKDKYARPEFIPVTNQSGDWYWLTRIQWAI